MKTRIPLSALAIDGEQPQAGDPVDLTASGTLDSVEGDMAVVDITTVNGSPLPQEGATGDEMGEDDLLRAEEVLYMQSCDLHCLLHVFPDAACRSVLFETPS